MRFFARRRYGGLMAQREKTADKVIKRDERLDGAIAYSYELSVKENKNQASFRIPLYSVKVCMIDETGEESSAAVEDAFCDAGQALIFYDKVVRNLATPIDLAYILEDEMQ